MWRRDAGQRDESQPLDFHSPYGCSKGAADQYVRDYARIYGLRSVVFRMSCIAGPRQFGSEDQGWVAHFLYSALEGKPLTIYGDGRQVRDVLHVDDLLRAFEAAYAKREQTAGQIYNIGGGAGEHGLAAGTDGARGGAHRRAAGLRLWRGARRRSAHLCHRSRQVFAPHRMAAARRIVDEILKGIYKWYRGNRELFAPSRAERLEQAELLTPAVRRTA